MQAKIIRAQAGGRIDFAGAWGDGCTLINPDNNENVLGRVCNVNLAIGSVVQIKATTQSGVRIICNCYNGMLDQNSAYGTDADLFLAAARRYCLFDTSCGWEIKAESTIPPRSGLGGSAALAVPLVACVLYALSKEEKYPQLRLENNNLNYVNRAFLAQEARALEIHEIKMSSGWQDQWAAAFGGINFIRAERDPQKPVRYEILLQKSEIRT